MDLHNEELFHSQKCGICNKTFTELIKLRVHLIKAHQLQRSFMCKHCGKIFSQKSNLEDHIKVHDRHFRQGSVDNVLEYIDQICEQTSSKKCNQCNKEFDSINNLRQHNYRYHNPKNASPQECEFCASEFKTKHGLNMHIDQVHKQTIHEKTAKAEKHNCDFCGKTFAQRFNLNFHIKQLHEGLRKESPGFPCNICRISYRRQIFLDMFLQYTLRRKILFVSHVEKLFRQKVA